MANKDDVPLMFRAQVGDRCSLQYAQSPDAETWLRQWQEGAENVPSEFNSPQLSTKSYQISWRFVSNVGQDDVIIRPVIGAKGCPFYPGSSMKGAFRQSCHQNRPDLVEKYCGKKLLDGSSEPGILRFHGGYPTNSEGWKNLNLLDVVHPQEKWQVTTGDRPSAKVQISLYRPFLKFGISSTIELDKAEWDAIWKIWRNALVNGIGCRTHAGYGKLEIAPAVQMPIPRTRLLFRFQLHGTGQAATLLNGIPEFRPNIFRAAIRGHAMRFLGGLTNSEQTAKYLTNILFGGIESNSENPRNQPIEGLLSTAVALFDPEDSSSNLRPDECLGTFQGKIPTYEAHLNLTWLLTREVPEEERLKLKTLIKYLSRFAMVFGGFGKSWRRADSRQFFIPNYQHLIGCHWQWWGDSLNIDERDLFSNGIADIQKINKFINTVRTAIREWMQLQEGIQPDTNQRISSWHEVWHRDTVQVWGRVATSGNDSRAIHWFHERFDPQFPQPTALKKSKLAGEIGRIGRLWHRMYPIILPQPRRINSPEIVMAPSGQFWELLTFFPSLQDERTSDFINFLRCEQDEFKQLWPRAIH